MFEEMQEYLHQTESEEADRLARGRVYCMNKLKALNLTDEEQSEFKRQIEIGSLATVENIYKELEQLYKSQIIPSMNDINNKVKAKLDDPKA